MLPKLDIEEEKHVIDQHVIELFQKDFRFNHEKGLAEWLKNSADAYNTINVPDSEQYVFLRFNNIPKPTFFECVDFVGMTVKDIEKALKRWYDPKAAKKGTNRATFGGHGNGGKYYMRGMFEIAHFITYRDGKLNVFGFNEKGNYGFAKGFKDKKMSLNEALKFARLKETDIPSVCLEKMRSGKTGFSVVKGISPKKMRTFTSRDVSKICTRILTHPQSRYLLNQMIVKVFFDDREVFQRLIPEKFPGYPELEEPIILNIPPKMVNMKNSKESIIFDKKKKNGGQLILHTSHEPLTGVSMADLNRIDIKGEIGTIASYKMFELGNVKNLLAAEFIYGECQCPILESKEHDCVKNDREKLAENDMVLTLLYWISEQVDDLASKIIKEEKKDEHVKRAAKLLEFNELLNKWKNRFMSSKVYTSIFFDKGKKHPGFDFEQASGEGSEFGGRGNEKGGKGGKEGIGGSGGDFSDDSGEKKIPIPNKGGEKEKKVHRFPRILLSGIDPDPLNISPDGFVHLDARHPPVTQRPQDVEERIYWINTSKKLARDIIDKYGEESTIWRNYHFQRFVDVITKEALRNLYKKNPENFTPDLIDSELIDKMFGVILDSASDDLKVFFELDQSHTVNKTQAVFGLIRQKPGITSTEIKAETGFDTTLINGVANNLVKGKKIEIKKTITGYNSYYPI